MLRLRPLATLALPALALACQPKSTTSPADEACNDFELDVRKSWNDETRIALRGEVMKWKGDVELEVAKSQATQVETTMDNFASDWVRLRKSACLDHFKREVISAEDYQARAACYDEVLLRQRALVQSALAGEETTIEAFTALADAVSSCSSS